MLVCSLAIKGRQGLTHNAMYTSATHVVDIEDGYKPAASTTQFL